MKPLSCGIPDAVNDRGAGVVASFGLPVEFDAAVMVQAASPRGRWVQFAIPASSPSSEIQKPPTISS